MNKKQVEYFMEQAMLEGRKALPYCLPNPPVGCVIVKDGKIVSRGYTNPPGQAHAEAMALNLLNEDLDDLSLFVTLEPCSFHGRTPSCAKRIISEKIKNVYIGIIDPHPKNKGAGIEILKTVDLVIQVGILQDEILKELNPYLLKEV